MVWSSVEEIEKLRTNQVELQVTTLKAGSLLEISSVTYAQADVEISFTIPMFDRAEVYDSNWRNP